MGTPANFDVKVGTFSNERFTLTDTVISVLDGHVSPANLPSSNVGARIGRLLRSIGKDIHNYFSDKYDPRWMSTVDGVLNNPWEHMHQVGDIKSVIVAVLKWRFCTGFVAIQTSDLNSSVIVYLANVRVHSVESSCEYAFSNTGKFKTEIDRVVRSAISNFMETSGGQLAMYKILQEFSVDAYRLGI